MAPGAADTIQAAQESLEQYIRPREEVAVIRHVLAAHLDSCLENGSVERPLALMDSSCIVTPTREAKGLQRDYLQALDANVKARRKFESVRTAHFQNTPSTPPRKTAASNPLEERVYTIRLRQKYERLQVIDKYLNLLAQKPAASEDFLDPVEIFRDATPLPQVPQKVVDGLVENEASTKTDLKELASHLEKSVLRAKLLLGREERLLAEVRSRCENLPERVSDDVRLQALSVTRNELITWMETELGKASGDGSEDADDDAGKVDGTTVGRAQLDDEIAIIKEKYAKYVAMRKSLVRTLSQTPQPVLTPPAEILPHAPTQQVQEATPTTHLLIPYLEGLLAVAHEQKGLITQKAHLNIALAKQLKDSSQVVDRLVEESQLLPAHPMPGSSRRKPGIGEGLTAPETLDLSRRVKEWVYAADSAKIATLEAVAEKVEEGQLALEDSMKILGDVDRLLGPAPSEGPAADPDTTEEDIWLAQSRLGRPALPRRKQPKPDNAKDTRAGNVWSVLDGNLGFITPEDDGKDSSSHVSR